MGSMQIYETVHIVMAVAMVTYIYVFALFLSIAVAITKWVHNPFNNDAIAVVVAISYHVNSPICLHRTHL